MPKTRAAKNAAKAKAAELMPPPQVRKKFNTKKTQQSLLMDISRDETTVVKSASRPSSSQNQVSNQENVMDGMEFVATQEPVDISAPEISSKSTPSEEQHVQDAQESTFGVIHNISSKNKSSPNSDSDLNPAKRIKITHDTQYIQQNDSGQFIDEAIKIIEVEDDDEHSEVENLLLEQPTSEEEDSCNPSVNMIPSPTKMNRFSLKNAQTQAMASAPMVEIHDPSMISSSSKMTRFSLENSLSQVMSSTNAPMVQLDQNQQAEALSSVNDSSVQLESITIPMVQSNAKPKPKVTFLKTIQPQNMESMTNVPESPSPSQPKTSNVVMPLHESFLKFTNGRMIKENVMIKHEGKQSKIVYVAEVEICSNNSNEEETIAPEILDAFKFIRKL